MAELLDVLAAFTMPLKMGWVVWFAWGIGQIFWYRRGRQSASTRPAPARKPFLSKPSTTQRTSTRLITPEPVIGQAPAQLGPPPFESPSFESPSFQPPSFEPPQVEAPALLEETDRVAELDRFVADFEMNTRQRRSGPVNGESSPFDGHTPHSA